MENQITIIKDSCTDILGVLRTFQPGADDSESVAFFGRYTVVPFIPKTKLIALSLDMQELGIQRQIGFANRNIGSEIE
jgi:hypothetical protein